MRGMDGMHIVEDDLRGAQIAALLQAHLDAMHAISPPHSVHALDLPALRAPDIRFWTLWDGDRLAGCGALSGPTPVRVRSSRCAPTRPICGAASPRGY